MNQKNHEQTSRQPDPPESNREVKTQPSPETLRQEAKVAGWLQAHSTGLEPRTGFLPESRRRLIRRIEQQARRSLWERAWATPRFRFAANAASFSVLVLVLAAFLSVVLAAARVALPGDPLYAVKLGVEQARVGLSLNDEQRASLYVAFASERSTELQALMIEGDYTLVEITSLRLLRQVETARLHLAQADDLSQEQQLALAQELNQTLSLQVLVLRALINLTPEASQPMVRHVLLAVY